MHTKIDGMTAADILAWVTPSDDSWTKPVDWPKKARHRHHPASKACTRAAVHGMAGRQRRRQQQAEYGAPATVTGSPGRCDTFSNRSTGQHAPRNPTTSHIKGLGCARPSV
jgi:hypothetical protein